MRCLLPLLVALLWSRVALAGELTYDADIDCPSRENVVRRMESKAPRSRGATISVRREGATFVGRIATEAGESEAERRVEGRTCDAVIDALVLVLVLALDRAPASEPPTPEQPPAPPPAPPVTAGTTQAPREATITRPRANRTARFGVIAGAAAGNFFGIPNTRARLGGVALAGRNVIGLRVEADWEPGTTEFGLQIHRLVVGVGAETVGRLRFGLGGHIPYTFVLRATEAHPFFSALLGDIGGFGIGGHVSLWVDVARFDALTLMLGARGDLETYFTGTSRQASAALSLVF